MMSDHLIHYEIAEGKELVFETHDELFSPQAIDSGTIAMLSTITVQSSDKVLDLGCGYGFVSVYLSAKYGLALTACDIDPLAVEYTRLNAQRNQVEVHALESDGLSNIADSDFTLILSNPPYHADFAVPKHFIEQGFRQLAIGGRMVMVVKRLLWYKNKLTSVFGGVRIKEIDGYYILEAQKYGLKSPKKAPKKTKSKHEKRLARSSKRR